MVKVDRRRFLVGGIGGLIAVAAGGYELVEQGVLPGKDRLDELLGECSVSGPPLTFAEPGPTEVGTFYSQARRRRVWYTLAYPPGHGPSSHLPLVISLHAYGGNHTSGLGGISLARALAATHAGQPLKPMAALAVDGGNDYWNPHPGDDPMAMIVDELLPFARQTGVGLTPASVGMIGISMGGYGALLFGEKHPRLISAVAAISPAIWTSYSQARDANAGAFASAADFADDDVVTHASALGQMPLRIASGNDDPFHDGVVALAAKLPKSAVVDFTAGCHDDAFFGSQQHQALAFLGDHLA
jgi:pimeloyl-ACP methyl ester carboxylesterase